MKPKKIKKILDAARNSGSIQLTGTREERKAQLRALRVAEMIKRGDNSTDTAITGSTAQERKECLSDIIKKQKGK